jgi:hypothetical protein
MKTKKCSVCGKTKSWDDFYMRSDRNTPKARCKACELIKQKEYYDKNKNDILPKKKAYNKHNCDRIRKYNRDYSKRPKVKKKLAKKKREYSLHKLYNLSTNEHYQMWVNQNGCCALCRQPIDYKNIKTEHNHITNKVRALTCHTCNSLLGFAYVDELGIKRLEEAIEYIRKYDE